MSTTRTFVAVNASDETRTNAAALVRNLRQGTSDVKWVDESILHWTLQFLGDVEDVELASVCDAVAAGAAELEPFRLVAHGAGAFPSEKRPRTLWLGAAEGGVEFVQLQEAVATELGKLGFRRENRKFVPHVTLGRVNGNKSVQVLQEALADLADFDGGATTVDEVIVYGSELSRSGPSYHVIGRAPLGPA